MPQHPNTTLAGALADGAHHWQHRRYADMNLAIRWMKAHAAFGGTPRVGALASRAVGTWCTRADASLAYVVAC